MPANLTSSPLQRYLPSPWRTGNVMTVWTDLEYRAGSLHFGGVDLSSIAEEVGTPCYVYSRGELERRFRACDESLAEADPAARLASA